ncbi:MAG: DNA polymerase [candidate division KSB1 bacterium]|nr:DNA polymerase [candidate division KSB1 bacterium]MDZ7274488.1 DNA polymerase [candidate division KSB1 bacterium]MDZ7284850.1 DNA polymerase [candidate division KSB1 bacterium]MDZ7297730.1 DNA polymerase [candidate division KSB1 bacterium]MDZ7307595.1 DNA polymerase [candidate division KSB1 bacterium]
MSVSPAIQENATPLRWLFLDLNSYFASIEQELRPELRGKPVAVVPVMTDRTCCIAASYEAKAFGVKTGTLVADAKKLCPKIQLVEARHRIYVEYHHKIVQAVESCLPVAAVLSIDEMACRLIGREREIENALAFARKIKQTLREKVGSTLRCSVGLAPNRFLAKVATDLQKPDGLVVIRVQDLPAVLHPVQLQDLPGIGARMHARLLSHGIRTVRQLCALSKTEMAKIWGGIIGERFWHWLRGDDLPEIATRRRTVGHSHVLPPELRNDEDAYAVAKKLVHKAAARLRHMNYWAGVLALSIRFGWQEGWSEKISMVECQDTLTMLEALAKLWRQRPPGNPLAVGVTLLDLVPNELHNLSLFEDPRRGKLARAMDAINAKYGTDAVYFGGIHASKHAAPTRIAFSSIPELWTFEEHC